VLAKPQKLNATLDDKKKPTSKQWQQENWRNYIATILPRESKISSTSQKSKRKKKQLASKPNPNGTLMMSARKTPKTDGNS